MEKIKTILLVVLVSCIVLGTAMYIFKRDQTKEEIIQEYQKHEEAFEYVKEYYITNDLARIFRYPRDKIISININGSGADIPLEDIDDELLVKYVRLLFDDLHYFWISDHSAWKENVLQLMFKKETNKTYYYKDIVYCEDGEPPISTSSTFYNVEQIKKHWFYCEENAYEDL